MSRLKPGIYTPEEAEAAMMADTEPGPPTPAEVRALLRECVTIVGPGEVLVIRVPYDTPWDKARGYQDVLDAAREAWGFRAIVVTAEELGVIPEAGDEAFDQRVMAAINRLDVRAGLLGAGDAPVTAELGCAWVGEDVIPNPPAFIAKGCGCADDPADT